MGGGNQGEKGKEKEWVGGGAVLPSLSSSPERETEKGDVDSDSDIDALVAGMGDEAQAEGKKEESEKWVDVDVERIEVHHEHGKGQPQNYHGGYRSPHKDSWSLFPQKNGFGMGEMGEGDGFLVRVGGDGRRG